jgi:hypothetical protein
VLKISLAKVFCTLFCVISRAAIYSISEFTGSISEYEDPIGEFCLSISEFQLPISELEKS